MGKLATAERVSRDASDNFVFQRSLLAYDRAAEIVSGDVLEIGTGTGYGIELVAPHCDRFVTVDKYAAAGDRHAANVEFRRMCVPPLGFGDESFDFVITFQVIEHIDDDAAFVREIARVLRPGGIFVQVLAGQGHLPGLKSIIYPAHVEKEKMLHPALPGFGLLHTQTLRFSFSLPDAQSVHDLLYMTPHVWRITKRGAEALAQTAQLTDTAEVIFNIYGRQEAGNLLE